MILVCFVTWAVTTAMYGAIAYVSIHRILTALQEHPDATRIVVNLMGFIARRPTQGPSSEPLPRVAASSPALTGEPSNGVAVPPGPSLEAGVGTGRRRNLLRNGP